jgi:hypothetical protein
VLRVALDALHNRHSGFNLCIGIVIASVVSVVFASVCKTLCALWMGVDAANILRTDHLFLSIVPSNT